MDIVVPHDSPFMNCTLSPGKYEGALSLFYATSILRYVITMPSSISKNIKHFDN
jgi:hypothetical protein